MSDDLIDELFDIEHKEEKDFVESVLEEDERISETVPPIKWWQTKFDAVKEITRI